MAEENNFQRGLRGFRSKARGLFDKITTSVKPRVKKAGSKSGFIPQTKAQTAAARALAKTKANGGLVRSGLRTAGRTVRATPKGGVLNLLAPTSTVDQATEDRLLAEARASGQTAQQTDEERRAAIASNSSRTLRRKATTSDLDPANIVPGTLTKLGEKRLAEQTIERQPVIPEQPGLNPQSALASAAQASEAVSRPSTQASEAISRPDSTESVEATTQPPRSRGGGLRPPKARGDSNAFQALAGLSFATNAQRAQVEANKAAADRRDILATAEAERIGTLRENIREQANMDRQFQLDLEGERTDRLTANATAAREARLDAPKELTENEKLAAQKSIAEINDPKNRQARVRGLRAIEEDPASEQAIATTAAFIEALSSSSNEGIVDFLRVPLSRLFGGGGPKLDAETTLEGFEFAEDGQIFFDDGTLDESGRPNKKFVTDVKDIESPEFRSFARKQQINQAKRDQGLRSG